MATQIGSLISAIGVKLKATFPDYDIIYGIPASGVRAPSGSVAYVHFAQEKGVFAGSQLGGPVRVSPTIAVTVCRPYSSDPTKIASEQATAELGADLRISICGLIMAHIMGTTPITGFTGQAIWISDYVMTPAILDIGTGQSTESFTAEFTLNYSSTYGGR